MKFSLYENDDGTGPRKIIKLSARAGGRFKAIWRYEKDKWYIIEPGNERNLKNAVEIFTPRQLQDAIENRKYFFEW